MIKTPLEDFTTEILAGILTANKEIGDAFANNILNIEGVDFSFYTQENYLLNEDGCPDCRVDMVVRSENILCFIENKVESREGYIQLDRYGRVLDNYDSELKTYLKYCTKYYDEKSIEKHNFHQFRWADIYRFLKQWQSSAIISDYLGFLNENDMSDNMDFTLNDLVSLQELDQVVKKMDRYLEKIKIIFYKYFDRSKLKDPINLKQIREHSRYIFHADFVFGQTGYSELGVGFEFGEVPSLRIWIWTDQRNDKSKLFKQAIQNTDLQSNKENWIGLSKPLTDFISSDKMELEIENWFANSFQTLRKFIEQTEQLDWHI